MLSLFNKYTSGNPSIRIKTNSHVFCWYKYPYQGRRLIKKYTIGPWMPLKVNPCDLPFNIDSSRIPRKIMGLSELLSQDSRIISFKLSDAVIYSLLHDIRFVSLLCLILGFTVWWSLVPYEILNHPGVLSSPDIGNIVRVTRDTFENNVCSLHQTPSPCDCGEHINREAKRLFECFDPLGLKPYKSAISVFVGAIILCMALTESISIYGIRCDCM